MTPAELLRTAREIVAGGWSKTREAEAADFTLVGFDSPDAVKWCPAAAMMKTAADAGISPLGEVVYWAAACFARAMAGVTTVPRGWDSGPELIDSIAAWNRNLDRRLEEVLDAFDVAIAIAETWQAEVERKLALAQIEDAQRAVKAS